MKPNRSMHLRQVDCGVASNFPEPVVQPHSRAPKFIRSFTAPVMDWEEAGKPATRSLNPGVTFRPMDSDLGDRLQIERLIETLDTDGRQIDILVNNFGIIRRAPVAEHSMDDWDDVMAVNVDATFFLSRELGRRMLGRGHGKIVNVASVLSFQGGVFVPGYAASKGAIAQLTRSFANEWASKGVNVNALAPGYVATDNTDALQKDAKRTAELMARVPAGRWGRADEIAWPVAFLCGDLADFIHGTVLAVDCGWLAR